MRDWKNAGLGHATRQKRADDKVHRQYNAVRALNGHAKDEPKAQQALIEMLRNKAIVDMNRALFDYAEANESDGKPGATA